MITTIPIPGGGIHVSHGLMALLEREDELAGVLAHEIAHVTQRHSAKQQRKSLLPGLLSLPGNVWSPSYTALVNGFTADEELREGQPVKIARQERLTQTTAMPEAKR